MEAGGQNYLLPVDATLASSDDVEDEAIPLTRLRAALEDTRRLRLIILDACRENPFLKSMRLARRAAAPGRGLVAVEAQASEIVAFAAAEGHVASDGSGEHSPYTASLLKRLTQPGVDIRKTFGFIYDDVRAATGSDKDGPQKPAFYAPQMGGEDVVLVARLEQPAAAAFANDTDARVRADFELAKGAGTSAAWDAFLRKYPTGFYADLARDQKAKAGAGSGQSSWLSRLWGRETPPSPAAESPSAGAAAQDRADPDADIRAAYKAARAERREKRLSEVRSEDLTSVASRVADEPLPDLIFEAQRAYEVAKSANSPIHWRQFLERFPRSIHADFARAEIARMEQLSAPAPSMRKDEALMASKKVKTVALDSQGGALPVLAGGAQVAPSPLGGWAVQLATEPTEAEARATATRLAEQYPSALQGRHPTFVAAKTGESAVYRIRVGDMSKDEANSLCHAILAQGGACFTQSPVPKRSNP
jgi:hypothetical protein